jgi:hypothetical protein
MTRSGAWRLAGLACLLALACVAGEAMAQGLSAPARNPFSVGVSEGGGQYTGVLGWIMSQQMAFERRAHTKRNDGDGMFSRMANDERHIVGAFGKHHGGRWRHGGVSGFIPPVLFAHRHGGGTTVTEMRLEGVDQGGRHIAWGNGGHQVLRRLGCVHGGYSCVLAF